MMCLTCTFFTSGFCEPGKELIEDICVACKRGYYKDNVGYTIFHMCQKCPDSNGLERTTDYEGSVSEANCSLCKYSLWRILLKWALENC